MCLLWKFWDCGSISLIFFVIQSDTNMCKDGASLSQDTTPKYKAQLLKNIQTKEEFWLSVTFRASKLTQPNPTRICKNIGQIKPLCVFPKKQNSSKSSAIKKCTNWAKKRKIFCAKSISESVLLCWYCWAKSLLCSLSCCKNI